MRTAAGLAVSRGSACGPVFLHGGCGDAPVPSDPVPPGGEAAELDRLRAALKAVAADLGELIDDLRERGVSDDLRVFEGHLMLLEDPLLVGDIERCVRKERLNAAAAVSRTVAKARTVFAGMADPYLRERADDLEDVARRILRRLAGLPDAPADALKVPSVVVAASLAPSDVVRLPRDLVLGLALDGGSATSHVALMARALGIPCVAALGDVSSRVEPGDRILLDGTTGAVTVNPDADTLRAWAGRMVRPPSAAADDGPPAGTLRDGSRMTLHANVHPGLPEDGVRASGACGIGLYRSEFLWLNGGFEPSEEEQFAAYRAAARLAAELAPGAAATLRTLDIGGDKLVSGLNAKEPNPFLGNRSIRYLLSHRETFAVQLRAMLRASAEGRVRILHPMVSCVEELDEAAEVLAGVRRELDAEGVPYDRDIPVGAMIEVPSAALIADALAARVDFLSVGTNDLVQYTLAADRGNEAVVRLHQPTHPAVLALLRMTVAAAKHRGIGVSVCGESAADPVTGLLWAAMGVDTLSMSPGYVPRMARVLRRLSRADLDEYAAVPSALGDGAPGPAVYAACRRWLDGRIPGWEEA